VQQLDACVAERRQVELAHEVGILARRRLAQAPGDVVALRPEREDEQQRRALGKSEQLLEQQHRCRVTPVQILDRDDERRLLGEAREELGDDFERAPLQRLRSQWGDPRLCVGLEGEPQQGAEVRIDLVGGLAEQLLEPSV